MSREIRRRIRASRAQEAAAMKRLGGTRHAGSGNGARKGDGRVNSAKWSDPEHQLVEFKRTDKRQITIKADDLEKVFSEALATGRTPVFGVELGGRNYVLQTEGDYRETLDLIREMREAGGEQ